MRGKYESSGKRTFGSRSVFLMLALVLVLGCTIGGTLAWLTAKTSAVENTFAAGQIGALELEEDADQITTEAGNQFIVIPGVDITKDPKVTYTPTTADGTVPVDAYVFVKLTGIGNNKWTWNADASQYEIKSGSNVVLSFKIADGWTAVPNAANVYYKTSTGTTGLTDEPIIKDNKITVSHLITEDDVQTVATAADKLTFTAYAIQQADGGTDNDGKFTPAEAWAKVSEESTSTTP